MVDELCTLLTDFDFIDHKISTYTPQLLIEDYNLLKGHNSQVLGISVFPDGSKAVSVASDRTLKIWDLHTGGAIASFSADSTLLNCTVAPDNTTIIAGDILGCVHFLRLENMDGVKEE